MDDFDKLKAEKDRLAARETNLPGIKSGIKAAHRIVTPTCRANKGDMEAGVEAALSLSESYDKYSKDDGGNVRWHFVLIREDVESPESS